MYLHPPVKSDFQVLDTGIYATGHNHDGDAIVYENR